MATFISVIMRILMQLLFIFSFMAATWIAIPYVTKKKIKGDVPLASKITILVVCLVGAIILAIQREM